MLVVARPHCAKTCAVIGFPNGTSTPAAKAAEASELVLAVGTYAEASLHRPDSDCAAALASAETALLYVRVAAVVHSGAANG